MIYGLYDEDMNKYIHVPFNLELMKIAAYYKQHNQIITMLRDTNFEKYSKVFYRKDYYNHDYNSKLLLNDRISFGGRAFAREKYLPLELDIEETVPDTSIYDRFLTDFSTTSEMNRFFLQMQRARHFRLSLDGQNVWDGFEKQFNSAHTKTLIIHDYAPNKIKDAAQIVDDYLKHKMSQYQKYVGFKFPLIVSNSQELCDWSIFYPTLVFYDLEYQGIIQDEALHEVLNQKFGRSICSRLSYNVAKHMQTEEEFFKELLHLYYQVVYLRMFHTNVTFIYPSNFFTDKRWERVIDFFNYYLKFIRNLRARDYNKLQYRDSMFNFARNMRGKWYPKKQDFEIEEVRELFLFLQENHYDLFKAFYECHQVHLVQGRLEPW